jgi:hypothetical protein
MRVLSYWYVPTLLFSRPALSWELRQGFRCTVRMYLTHRLVLCRRYINVYDLSRNLNWCARNKYLEALEISALKRFKLVPWRTN